MSDLEHFLPSEASPETDMNPRTVVQVGSESDGEAQPPSPKRMRVSDTDTARTGAASVLSSSSAAAVPQAGGKGQTSLAQFLGHPLYDRLANVSLLQFATTGVVAEQMAVGADPKPLAAQAAYQNSLQELEMKMKEGTDENGFLKKWNDLSSREDFKTSGLDWSDSARTTFLRTGNLTCLPCKSVLAIKSSTGNIGHHLGTKSHATAFKTWASNRNLLDMSFGRSVQRSTAETAEEKKARLAAVAENSKFIAVNALRAGVNMSATSKLLSGFSMECIRFGLKHNVLPGSDTTMRKGIVDMYEKAVTAVKKAVADKRGAIVIDGATFRETKAQAIIFLNGVTGPLLLRLGLPGADGSYTANDAARDILDVLREFEIPRTRVTCLMGDNVNFNNAVADKLNVYRGHCLPHALALSVKHGTNELSWHTTSADARLKPALIYMTMVASGLLYRGGSARRVAAFRTAGLQPDKIRTYSNRFGTVVKSAKYVKENFDAVSLFFTQNAAFPLDDTREGQDDHEEDDEEEEKEENGFVTRVNAAMQLKRVREIFRSPLAKVVLYINEILFEKAAELITTLSGEHESVKKDVVGDLEILGRVWQTASQDGSEVVSQAMAKAEVVSNTALSPKITKLKDQVKVAARVAHIRYKKYVETSLPFLKYRFLYDVRYEPTLDPDRMQKQDAGVLDTDFGPGFREQYRKFKEEWQD